MDLKLVVKCHSCRETFDQPEDYDGRCPECGGNNISSWNYSPV